MPAIIFGTAAIGLVMMWVYAIPASEGAGLLAGVVIAIGGYWAWDRWR